MKNWLITGGCGFLGTALVKRLLNGPNNNIRVLDNLSVGSRDDLGLVARYREKKGDFHNWDSVQDVSLVVGDIVDEELAFQVTQRADIVVHLAANAGVGPSVKNPRQDLISNVLGTFNYLDAARLNKVPRFVFASSGAPAGEVVPPIHEELPTHPVSPYGASKLAGEGYCSAYNKTFGLDTITLRFGNVYGPGSFHKNSVVAKFISQAINNETLEVYGDGLQTRDFIFIDDLINAVLLSAEVPGIGGETFQIASSQETSVNELTDLLTKTLMLKGIKNVRVKHSQRRSGDMNRNFSDTSKARNRLGWQSEVEIREGLEKTVDYFLNLQNIDH